MTSALPLALVLLCLAAQASVADDVRFGVVYAPGDKLKITERSDLRRYEDGSFVGLSYREVRGVLDVRAAESAAQSAPESAAEVEGSFYVFEETRRDSRLVARRIDEVVPVRFSIRADGTYDVPPDQPYPALRSFPVFPGRDLGPGDRWEASGARVVEPLRDGRHTRVRIYAGYEYQGPAVRDGRDLQLVTARYALRYKAGDDPLGDPRIRSISGTHSAKIYFDEAARRPVFVETLVDETYAMEGGKSVGFKGFILTWYEGITAMDRGLIAEDVRKALGPELSPAASSPGSRAAGVKVSETGDGVKLEISDIRFVADQAVVLPQEKPRLDAVARALKAIQGRTFRVIGHTARAGTEAGQKALSIARARAIVDFLASSGIDAGRFVYEGRGAAEPVASNDTPEGMARNRRVEIIILED